MYEVTVTRRVNRRTWKHVSVALFVCLLLGLLASVLQPLPESLLRTGRIVSLRITDRIGILLREVPPDGRGRPVPLDAVAPAVVQALVATEDRHFFSHPGVNPFALVRAAWANATSGTVVSGGSTITMQVARTLLDADSRRWTVKLAEMHLALRLEVYLSKDEILALWLNRVPFGNRVHGIEAASRFYFGKSARDLTVPEAAYLVGLPQSPTRYNPLRYPERARARQGRVLRAMRASGVITAGEEVDYAALPLEVAAGYPAFRVPHLSEHLVTALRDVGPVEIRTTIDWPLQQAVEELLGAHIGRLRTRGASNAAALVLDNATGDVLAYAGSVDFWDTQAGGQNDGVSMLRQPGSALKPFTYALAIASRRYTPASILPDLELHVPEAGGAFSPENYDGRYHGPVPLRQALASSYNVPAVRLARELGAPALLRTLHQSGFNSLTRPADHYGVGLTLGNGEVRMLELVRAYAGLARGGTLPPLRFERWRVTVAGDTLHPAPESFSASGISPDVAYLITDMLSDPEARAPAFGRGGPLELPFPCAVKTGTSRDYRDNWTVGYTPRHTVAVWVGNFDGSPMQWVSGVSGAGPLFKAIFLVLGSGGDFPRPDGIVEATVCPASGLRPSPICPSGRTESFLAGTAPTGTCDVHRAVLIDRRTGLLADGATPKSEQVTEVYLDYPPLYHAWMREQGLPMPPTGERAPGSGTDARLFSDQLLVQYPESGTSFQIDPVLRAEFQRLHLVGSAGDGVQDVAWWVDGEELDADYRTASWRLRPGRHEVELRGVARDGTPLRSRPVEIHVSGVE